MDMCGDPRKDNRMTSLCFIYTPVFGFSWLSAEIEKVRMSELPHPEVMGRRSCFCCVNSWRFVWLSALVGRSVRNLVWFGVPLRDFRPGAGFKWGRGFECGAGVH